MSFEIFIGPFVPASLNSTSKHRSFFAHPALLVSVMQWQGEPFCQLGTESGQAKSEALTQFELDLAYLRAFIMMRHTLGFGIGASVFSANKPIL